MSHVLQITTFHHKVHKDIVKLSVSPCLCVKVICRRTCDMLYSTYCIHFLNRQQVEMSQIHKLRQLFAEQHAGATKSVKVVFAAHRAITASCIEGIG